MKDLAEALRTIADRIEAGDLQGGTVFEAVAEPGQLTIRHQADETWQRPADCVPLIEGWYDHGIYRAGYRLTIDL